MSWGEEMTRTSVISVSAFKTARTSDVSTTKLKPGKVGRTAPRVLVLKLPLTVLGEPGERTLDITVGWQACDDSSCLAPDETTVQASLTGHLVLSTLHTNDAASAITRLVHIGIEPYLVAATLRGVLAQRLVRKICPHCKEQFEPDSLVREMVETLAGPFEHLSRGHGCSRCRGTGFAGRIGIFELLVPEDDLLARVADGATLHEIREQLVNNGFTTLRVDGMVKVQGGLTTAEEVLNVTVT